MRDEASPTWRRGVADVWRKHALRVRDQVRREPAVAAGRARTAELRAELDALRRQANR